MPQERTEAVVLRGVDFSETSRIVTFLCPERGRMACIAKGVKRPKSQLAGLLDTFNRLEIVVYYKDSRSVQVLAEASLLDSFTALKSDLDRTTYGAFPLEIVDRVARENEPSRELYAALVEGLEGLGTWTGDVRTHCCWQVLRLLGIAGFAPSLDVCCECGASAGDRPSFSFGGGVTCARCPSDRRLAREDYAALKAFAAHTRRCPDIEVNATLFSLLDRYASRQLETNLKSARVIEQVFR